MVSNNVQSMQITRRSFVTQSGLLAGSALGLSRLTAAAAPVPSRLGRKPQRIIHLIRFVS